MRPSASSCCAEYQREYHNCVVTTGRQSSASFVGHFQVECRTRLGCESWQPQCLVVHAFASRKRKNTCFQGSVPCREPRRKANQVASTPRPGPSSVPPNVCVVSRGGSRSPRPPLAASSGWAASPKIEMYRDTGPQRVTNSYRKQSGFSPGIRIAHSLKLVVPVCQRHAHLDPDVGIIGRLQRGGQPDNAERFECDTWRHRSRPWPAATTLRRRPTAPA